LNGTFLAGIGRGVASVGIPHAVSDDAIEMANALAARRALGVARRRNGIIVALEVARR
jgi:hypothetical protein